MPVLDAALRSGLDNGDLAALVRHFAQVLLNLRLAEHGHFLIIEPVVAGDVKINGRERPDDITGLLQKLAQKKDGR